MTKVGTSVIGTLINRLATPVAIARDQHSVLLSQTEFNREIARERIRATRRAIPFCLIKLELIGRRRFPQRRRSLVQLLHRNLRLTDQKADLGGNRIGVLLVDTPETGGRAVVDRLSGLCQARRLDVSLSLQVYDPEGFNCDEGFDRPHRGLRRAIDVVGASVGLLLVSPILLLSAIAIKLTTPGPAFFKQTREGLGGRPFTIYKLRTMVADAERLQAELRVDSHRDGPAFKIKNDPRVTRVGAFLRRTCIDELPQLINIIRGEMSLVGPRPLPWEESRACNHWHRRRLDVLPGLTCHWQVNKASAETFDDWMRMDLRYVDRNTVWQDLKLIARTVVVPFSGRGSD